MDNIQTLDIELERGSHGLGFNIRGGVDIPYITGDTGIFVTKIRSDGAAYADKRLNEGDKILEVNGHNLERVTHNEAVQAFVNAGEIVKLKVYQGAEKEIKKRLAENSKINASSGNSSSASDGNGGSPVGLLIGLTGFSVTIAVVGFFVYKRYGPR